MKLTRFFEDATCTLGHLVSNDGQFACYTIERPATGEHPRIPAGTYDVTYETHHPYLPDGSPNPKAYRCPVLDTSAIGRSHIQLHVANYASELLGCIAVGETYSIKDHCVNGSAEAFSDLMAYLPDHPWTLEIVDMWDSYAAN